MKQPGNVYQSNHYDDNSKYIFSVCKLVHLFSEYKKLAQYYG